MFQSSLASTEEATLRVNQGYIFRWSPQPCNCDLYANGETQLRSTIQNHREAEITSQERARARVASLSSTDHLLYWSARVVNLRLKVVIDCNFAGQPRILCWSPQPLQCDLYASGETQLRSTIQKLKEAGITSQERARTRTRARTREPERERKNESESESA